MDREDVENDAGSGHDKSLDHLCDMVSIELPQRTENDIPMDTLTTCKRLPVSMYCPTAGAKTMAEIARVNA
jgi:hypothetical protein